MDPLILELLRFGTAILAGGLVAVIAQRLAFGHAQKLARAERADRRASTVVALAQEVEENIARAGPKDRTQAPIRISQSAWDAARGIELPATVSIALGHAYALGEDLNSRIATVDGFSATPIVAASGSDAAAMRENHSKALIEASHLIADRTYEAFAAARDVLLEYRSRGG